MGAEWLGALYCLIAVALVVGLFVFLMKRFGMRVVENDRDRKIEQHMREGMRDAAARQRIERKLKDEMDNQ